MKLSHTRFAGMFSLLAATAVLSSVAFAGTQATPAVVTRAAVQNRARLRSLVGEVDLVMKRMATDEKFNAELLDVVKSGDTQKVGEFIKSKVEIKSDLVVEEANTDYCIKVNFKRWGLSVRAQFGGDCKGKLK